MAVDEDKPLWPLASYGHGKCEATLIAGFDESPEELRAWQALKSGDAMALEGYARDTILSTFFFLLSHANASTENVRHEQDLGLPLLLRTRMLVTIPWMRLKQHTKLTLAYLTHNP
ncbi:MAG TPA: hypothetical protein VGO47_09145, partial [Chlamydiales bacterium]|nr:hypothetical protein [Chlamydiales bacterium]